jgi:hypothetical protein
MISSELATTVIFNRIQAIIFLILIVRASTPDSRDCEHSKAIHKSRSWRVRDADRKKLKTDRLMHNRLYFSGESAIYRANKEVVL